MRAAPTFLEEATPSRIPALRPDLRTNLLTVFVVLTNVLGNFSLSWGMKHQTTHLGISPLPYIRLIFSPWILARHYSADLLAAVADDTARLGRPELRVTGNFHRIRTHHAARQILLRRAGFLAALAGNCVHRARHHSGRPHASQYHAGSAKAGANPMRWLMVAIIVGSTVIADLLQSSEMKRQAVAAEDLRPGRWGRVIAGLVQRGPLVLGSLFHGDLLFRVHEAAVCSRSQLRRARDCSQLCGRNRSGQADIKGDGDRVALGRSVLGGLRSGAARGVIWVWLIAALVSAAARLSTARARSLASPSA